MYTALFHYFVKVSKDEKLPNPQEELTRDLLLYTICCVDTERSFPDVLIYNPYA